MLTVPVLAEDASIFSHPFKASQEAEEKEKVLFSELNGVVLLGNFEDLDRTAYKNERGVTFLRLSVPGDSDKLKSSLSAFLHRPLTQRDLYRMEKIIITFYQENKHPLVLVKVPQQETKGGVLQVVVLESVLGKITSTGAKWFSNERIARNIRLKPGELIDEGTLVQDLFWMNRNPFHKTSVIYSPGEKDATTNIELVTKDRFPLRTYGGTDNTGLNPIQRNRLYAGFNFGNVFNLDHVLTYQYSASYNIKDFQAHTVHYTAPLSWRHVFIVFGGYSHVHTKMLLHHFKSHGESLQASGRYTIPIRTGTQLLHEGTFGFDFKRTNNTVEFSETPVFGKQVNLTQFLGEYSLGYEGKHNTKTSFVASLFFSPASIVSDASKADFESLRPHATPRYVYFLAQLAEEVRFDNCSLMWTFRGQVSSANLLPSEQMGIGGYNTVRGYEERLLNYDDGVMGNVEFRSAPIRIVSKKSSSLDEGLQFLAFVDYGTGCNHRRVEGEKSSRYLLSVGPGVRFNINPYVAIRFDYGIKLHKVSGDRTFGRPHFAVTVGY